MVIKNVDTAFVEISDLTVPDTLEVTGGVVSIYKTGLNVGNTYDLLQDNTIEEIRASSDLEDLILANKIIIVSGSIEFTQAESLTVLKDASLIQAPFIQMITPGLINPNVTGATITVTGANFNENTIVKFSSSGVTVTDVRVLTDSTLEVDVDTGPSVGMIDIALFNGCRSSKSFIVDNGQNAVDVQVSPNGPEKYLRIASASGDKYIGTAFAKSQYNASYNADCAFDNNNGSRHYSAYNQQQDHYCGILMTVDTLLTKVAYYGSNGSTPFSVEGSSDTTDGTDGTWVEIISTQLNNNLLALSGLHVYRGFRLKWTNPDSSTFASAREIKFIGRQ